MPHKDTVLKTTVIIKVERKVQANARFDMSVYKSAESQGTPRQPSGFAEPIDCWAPPSLRLVSNH